MRTCHAVLGISLGLLAAMASWAAGSAAQQIDAARFERAGQPPERVALPDTWAWRGVPLEAAGRYRLAFTLDAVPESPWALRFTHLSTDHRIRLNGELIAGEGSDERRASNPGHPVPALIALPPALLRAGANEVTVTLRYSTRGGLSAVELGPLPQLREHYQHDVLRRASLPQALNMVAAGLALLLLLIWSRRRAEVALGAFGGLALLAALRNYSYFLVSAIGPARSGDWMIFASHVWSVALLGVFAQHFAGVRWPRFTQALMGGALLLSLAGAWAIAEGHPLALRRVAYPLLIAATLPSLWLCLKRARAQGGWPLGLQAAGVGAVFVAGVHDYGLQTAGWFPITEPFWSPYVMPLALIAVSLALVRRMVQALGEVESLAAGLEARVRERTRELEAANAAKTRFLASASHDLRQPLVAVGLTISLARDRAESDAQRRLLDRADESVAAMEGLMTGLLDLSKLESGAVQAERGPVRLAELWAAIEAHEAAAAALKGLHLRLRPTDAVVLSDAVLLERALRNLVANAIRYTERGSVLVAARRRAGGRVAIEVRDSGIGIAAADQARVFEEFVQLDNRARERARGLGLGLAIVRRSAELLGHPLALRSAPGRGSCFTLTLPLAPAGSAAGAAPLPPRDTTAPRLHGRAVLLIEDDPEVRAALAARLASWGARLQAFADLPPLADWLDSAQARRPDLVIADYRLPSGSGVDAIARVRARFGGADIAALLITGDTAPTDLARLQAARLPVLHKPFRSEALARRLAEALPAD